MKVITGENYPVSSLKNMWKEIFGDTERYISLFFREKFIAENTFLIDDGGLKAMAYAVEEKTGDFKCAYICGVATEKNSRGKGYANKIMEYMKRTLCERGYDFMFLIPASESLFGFYKKSGFEIFSYISRYEYEPCGTISYEEFSEEYNYEKLNRFYTQLPDIIKVERDEKSFRAIYDCYGNVRIYKSGYMIYYVEKDTVNIVEHTMKDITPYVNRLIKDTGAARAVITAPGENIPFSMIYKFRPVSFEKPVYINLMLN